MFHRYMTAVAASRTTRPIRSHREGRAGEGASCAQSSGAWAGNVVVTSLLTHSRLTVGWQDAGKGALLGAEQPVAGVTETRHDIALLVEGAVHRRGVDRHFRMLVVQGGDTFRAGEQADELDGPRPEFLEPVDRGHRRIAGGQHRVDDHDLTLVQVAG